MEKKCQHVDGPVIDNSFNINYKQYRDHNVKIHKCIVRDLKLIAKHNKLKISGRKKDIIDRIQTHFTQNIQSELIQKNYRKHLVLVNLKLRGPALYKRDSCINKNDFITLNGISNIDWCDFFSYTDDKNNTYGFEMYSLIEYIKKSNQQKCIINPYNREPITSSIISRCIRLCKSTNIICTDYKKDEQVNLTNPYHHLKLNEAYYSPYIYTELRLTSQLRELHMKISYMRKDNLECRIRNVFIEFDRLGNYTNSSWINSLTLQYFPKLLRTLYDIWTFRANLPSKTKKKICCLFDPFQNILHENMLHILHSNTSNIFLQNYAKIICITIFENFIYTGIDEEHCKLGAMYCLIALTRVSQSARIMLPWLYEAIV